MNRKSNGLSRKTAFGFVQLIIILGVCLFAPVWSFHYGQAWIYMFVFAVPLLFFFFEDAQDFAGESGLNFL